MALLSLASKSAEYSPRAATRPRRPPLDRLARKPARRERSSRNARQSSARRRATVFSTGDRCSCATIVACPQRGSQWTRRRAASETIRKGPRPRRKPALGGPFRSPADRLHVVAVLRARLDTVFRFSNPPNSSPLRTRPSRSPQPRRIPQVSRRNFVKGKPQKS